MNAMDKTARGQSETIHFEFEFRHPPRIRYTWLVGDLDTVVTFTLDPTPTGTRLFLEHTGFQPHQKRNFGGARYGWRMMGDKLVNLLGEPSGATRLVD